MLLIILYFKYFEQFYVKMFCLATHTHIFDRNNNYFITLFSTSVKMAIWRPKEV
jgi:hypothetical protein